MAVAAFVAVGVGRSPEDGGAVAETALAFGTAAAFVWVFARVFVGASVEASAANEIASVVACVTWKFPALALVRRRPSASEMEVGPPALPSYKHSPAYLSTDRSSQHDYVLDVGENGRRGKIFCSDCTLQICVMC